MGQKVNPIGLRLGINRTWDSRWFADANYADLLHEDLDIREFLRKRLKQAGVSRIIIERPAKKARVTIHTARPGVVIGKKGADIEKLRSALQKPLFALHDQFTWDIRETLEEMWGDPQEAAELASAFRSASKLSEVEVKNSD